MKTETNNKDSKAVKLSPKQKEVIRLMREGYRLWGDRLGYYLSKPKHQKIKVEDCPNILYYFFMLDLIDSEETKRSHWVHYNLTELGKTIDIN